MTDEQFVQAFQQNYTRVNNYLGNSNQQLMMSLATKYTLNKQSFSGVALYKVMEQLYENKKRSFLFQMETPISYKLAAYLLDQGNIENAISQIIENDNVLRRVGFKNSPFRSIGALFLQTEEHAIKAKTLFDELNQKQRILTSKEDIPYALLLTTDDKNDSRMIAETVYRYYKELREQSFSMGNHLQALAQIMAIYNSEYSELYLQYVVQLRDEIVKRNLKVSKIHYPFIGLLALAATDDSKLNDIQNLHNQLLEQKVFKWNKEYALMVAIQKVVTDLMDAQNVVDMTPLSSLDQLLTTLGFIDEIVTFLPTTISDIVDFFN